MEEACERFSGTSLSQINACRMFLHVTTLADIVTESGDSIEQWALDGSNQLPTTVEWPLSYKPNPSSWRKWRSFLRSQFLINNSMITPLAKWKITKNTYRRHHFFLTGNNIIETKNIVQIIYQRNEQDQQQFHYVTCRQMKSLTNGQPIKCNRTSTHVLTLFSRPSPTKEIQPPTDIHSYLSAHQPPWVPLFLGHTTLPSDNGQAIEKEICKCTLKCGSDGSLQLTKTGFGFVLHVSEFENSLSGYNRCHTSANIPSYLQGEIEGLLATLFILQAICTVHHIQKGACTIYIDNTETLDRLKNSKPIKTSQRQHILRPEFSSEWLIHEITSKLPITCTGIWIKSHTNEDSPGHNINQISDLLANKGRKLANPPSSSFRLASPNPVVLLNGIRITAHDMSTINEYSARKRITRYLTHRGIMSSSRQ